MKAIDIVFSIAKPIAKEYGLDIWDVVFEKEGINWFLRIYLDKNDGKVTIDDCEKVSGRMKLILLNRVIIWRFHQLDWAED